MLSVKQAEDIIFSCTQDYGDTLVPLLDAIGRVLAEDIVADRDLPPFNRVAMDGIAIRYSDYENGLRNFAVAGVIGAGEPGNVELPEQACFEIMTGAVLPPTADTIVPYEHVQLLNGVASIVHEPVNQGQNVHAQGKDKKQGAVLVPAGKRLSAIEISVAASVGLSNLRVRNLPRIAIFSSGNELVSVAETPLPYQIRRSNTYAVHAMLQAYGIDATLLHLPDNLEVIKQELRQICESYDVLILSGGISMGKFDYIPQALAEAGVEQRFHKVKQKPGKPFWFGVYGASGVVFALPGNPVSTFLCLLRYTLPWLEATLGLPQKAPVFAVLDRDIHFEPALQYFVQVRLTHDASGVLHAEPLRSNGSGDFANLAEADGFMELPETQTDFRAGEAYRVWMYR